MNLKQFRKQMDVTEVAGAIDALYPAAGAAIAAPRFIVRCAVSPALTVVQRIGPVVPWASAIEGRVDAATIAAARRRFFTAWSLSS